MIEKCIWIVGSHQELRSDRLDTSEDRMLVVPWNSLLGWLSVSISPEKCDMIFISFRGGNRNENKTIKNKHKQSKLLNKREQKEV